MSHDATVMQSHKTMTVSFRTGQMDCCMLKLSCNKLDFFCSVFIKQFSIELLLAWIILHCWQIVFSGEKKIKSKDWLCWPEVIVCLLGMGFNGVACDTGSVLMVCLVFLSHPSSFTPLWSRGKYVSNYWINCRFLIPYQQVKTFTLTWDSNLGKWNGVIS